MSASSWDALIVAMGGRAELAAHLEVNDSTVWRWMRNASRPNGSTRRAINALCEKHNVAAVFP